jgi:hypothetical protein
MAKRVMKIPRKRLFNIEEPGEIAAEINRWHQECERRAVSSVEAGIQSGIYLIRAKAVYGEHGNWLKWLEDFTILSQRTSQLYMRLANNQNILHDRTVAKYATIADLTLNGADRIIKGELNTGPKRKDTQKDDEKTKKARALFQAVRDAFKECDTRAAEMFYQWLYDNDYMTVERWWVHLASSEDYTPEGGWIDCEPLSFKKTVKVLDDAKVYAKHELGRNTRKYVGTEIPKDLDYVKTRGKKKEKAKKKAK